MREDMNSPYGGLTTTGGKGWKHNCSLRLLFQKGDYIDVANNKMKRSAEDPAGNLVMMNITKTKICKPDRRVGYYTLKYDTGIDVVADIVDTALKNNLIIQMGSWFNFVDLSTGAVLKKRRRRRYTGTRTVVAYRVPKKQIMRCEILFGTSYKKRTSANIR